MLKNIDTEHIKKTNWYRQGGAGAPYFFYTPFVGGMTWWGRRNAIIQETGVLHHGFFNRDVEFKFALKHIEKQKRHRKHIDKLMGGWQKWIGAMDKFLSTIDFKGLRALIDKELIKKYKKMRDIDLELWKIAIMIESYDPWAEKIIADAIQNSGLDITAADKDILVSPEKLSFKQEEELNLCKICLSPKEKQEKLLRAHQGKYFWMDNDWAHMKILGVEYFKRSLKRLSNAAGRAIEEKIHNYRNFTKTARKEKQKITRKYHISSDLQNIFYFFSQMAVWRDWRKAAALRYNHFYHLFAREFSRRTGIDYAHVIFLTPQEIIDSKLIFSNEMKKNLKQRSKNSVYHADKDDQPIVLVGDEYAEFMKILESAFSGQYKELKGVPACVGTVTGKVKIINVPADFKKMRAGDILVAPMTRPEYMPLMKMAAAIITDEGGVTCHAAIVSRELGKPCIIGAQVATEVLKDGDMVEVDANRGIIKRIG